MEKNINTLFFSILNLCNLFSFNYKYILLTENTERQTYHPYCSRHFYITRMDNNFFYSNNIQLFCQRHLNIAKVHITEQIFY